VLKFPRRFALRATDPDQTIRLQVSVAQARGARSLRFGVALESASDASARRVPVRLQLDEPGSSAGALWAADLIPNAAVPIDVQQVPPERATALAITAVHLLPGDTLWFYELALEADDFTP
jgi:hypothetical protein